MPKAKRKKAKVEKVKVVEAETVENIASDSTITETDVAGTAVKTEIFSRAKEDKKQHRTDWSSRIFWAFLFIFAGTLLLLNNFGLVAWDAWLSLFRFWPVFLILIGLQLVFGRSLIGKVVLPILTLLIMLVVGAIVIMTSSDGWLKEKLAPYIPSEWVKIMTSSAKQETKEISIIPSTYTGVEKIALAVDMSAGTTTLTDSSGIHLVNGAILYDGSRDEPVETNVLNGTTRELSYSIKSKPGFFNWFNSVKREINLDLGKSFLPTDISLNISAGRADVELDEINVNSFVVDQSAGSSVIKFGWSSLPKGVIKVDVSAGSAKVYIPASAKLRVKYSMSAGSVSVSGKVYREMAYMIQQRLLIPVQMSHFLILMSMFRRVQ